MKTIIAAFLVAVAGCSTSITDSDIPLLCECFSQAAYEAVRAKSLKPEAPRGCCGKCNNTGKVRSGDGLSIVPCPCPPTCRCKR